MIVIKQESELKTMKKACQIAALALKEASKIVCPGVTTLQINRRIEQIIRSHNARPSFLNYDGFPAEACVSVNDEVIHGIPSGGRVLQNGDIVSVDVGAFYGGFHGDNAATFVVEETKPEVQKLLEVTKESLRRGIDAAVVGARIGDISNAIQKCVEENGFSVIKSYVGHGVGRELHEGPEVPNYGKPNRGVRLVEGMTLAIEPMVSTGKEDVRTLEDKWTVVTCDGGYAAHFEHTIAITKNGPEVLTLC